MAYAWLGTLVSNSSAGSAASIAASVTYTAGDRVQVWITYGSATTLGETVSDTVNTYTKVGSTLNDATNGQSFAVYESLSVTAGTRTVTFTPASSIGAIGIAIFRQSGLSTSVAAQIVSQNQNAPGSGANALTSTNLTPAAQPGMLLGLSMDTTGSESVINAGTGFTSEGAVTGWDTSFGTKSRVEDKRLTATSAVAATFTAGSGTGRFDNFALFIPEPGATGGSTFPPVPGVLTSLPTLLTM